MAKQKKSKFVSVITWLLLLLLLIGCIGLILHFLGIGKDDITDIINPTFRVEYDGNVYKADTENVLALPESGQARFEIKNCESCTVKVLPNVTDETDFTFTADGNERKYSDVSDLTAVFIQTNNVYGEYFIIDCDNDYSLESVLSSALGADSVVIPVAEITDPYKLVVTSSDGEVIEILFGGTHIYGFDIVLNPSSIIF